MISSNGVGIKLDRDDTIRNFAFVHAWGAFTANFFHPNKRLPCPESQIFTDHAMCERLWKAAFRLC